MARINVEDDWFSDPLERRAALIRAVQKLPVNWTDVADGMALRAWRLAQRFWKDGRRHIPEDVWARAGLEPLVECDLAIRKKDGVYVRGAESQHDWLRQKAQAGKARTVTAKRDEHGRFVPADSSDSPADAGNPLVKSPAPASEHTSLFSTLQQQNQDFHGDDLPVVVPREPIGRDVWLAYEGAYFARYGVPPVRNAKSNALCKQLVKRLGGDAAVGVVKFYLTHQKAYYVSCGHSLSACVADAESLHTQMITGKKITRASASHADKGAAQRQVFEDVAKKLAAKGLFGGGGENGK